MSHQISKYFSLYTDFFICHSCIAMGFFRMFTFHGR